MRSILGKILPPGGKILPLAPLRGHGHRLRRCYPSCIELSKKTALFESFTTMSPIFRNLWHGPCMYEVSIRPAIL